MKPATPVQALIAAIHAVMPPVLLGGVVVNMTTPHHMEAVTVTFVLTPELVTAWGNECAKLGVDTGVKPVTRAGRGCFDGEEQA